jgi:uncharacterized protein YoxC
MKLVIGLIVIAVVFVYLVVPVVLAIKEVIFPTERF